MLLRHQTRKGVFVDFLYIFIVLKCYKHLCSELWLCGSAFYEIDQIWQCEPKFLCKQTYTVKQQWWMNISQNGIRRAVNLAEAVPESPSSYIIWVSELQISIYCPKVSSWQVFGNKLVNLQKYASAVSDWCLNRSTKYARVCLACLGFLIRKHFAVAAQISVPQITAHNCHFLISFQQP